MDPINERKLAHLRIIESDPDSDRRRHYFDAIRLKHRALPELNLAEVDPSIEFMGRRLSFPLLISSMTGGDHEILRRINRNLAIAAEKAGVAMGVGSQRVLFSNPAARASFEIRPHAPTTLLLANLGAVQLNRGFGIEECREALAVSGADALCLHLNPLQEAVQPRGDTDFAGLAEKIGGIVRALGRPVVVKEVGAGISREDAELLLRAGVRYVDVAGAGGTSWSRVEHHSLAESEDDPLGLVFQDWGIPTPDALRALNPCRDRLTLIASGGLRNGIDLVKALALGASLCGMAAPFLRPAMESAEAVGMLLARLKREFTTALFLLGIRRAADLVGNESVLRG
ncbi:MAG TPA: type 2 isopentenyl-diphosphate Delta-isomerase [Kiritimatiellia bacterium]|nr:type 2 isopentenyl-diphosphate Delta-isomerase [Kiritimatiellia bacterium]HRZ13093.1 type 2 isopentenyl-diphosphate Delta-isomerase [Kiritimatiellia bacterium]HSA17514.1 type 2 isopentenyl-diphosphate Delta-isomerase [Kiritimatiellia bacterium]